LKRAVYFPDLSTECSADEGACIRAIGWLSSAHDFPKGEVPPQFLEKLREHLKDPWQTVAFWGYHKCDLCPPHVNAACGKDNLWIPGNGVVYVAPAMVLHYIEAHQYKPPDEFIAAVLECPEQKSPEYLKRMDAFPNRLANPQPRKRKK
jgi:hypothetical protein